MTREQERDGQTKEGGWGYANRIIERKKCNPQAARKVNDRWVCVM